MDIKRSGSQPSTKGAAEYFTGTVRIDPLFEAHDRARTLGASVTFNNFPHGQPQRSKKWQRTRMEATQERLRL